MKCRNAYSLKIDQVVLIIEQMPITTTSGTINCLHWQLGKVGWNRKEVINGHLVFRNERRNIHRHSLDLVTLFTMCTEIAKHSGVMWVSLSQQGKLVFLLRVSMQIVTALIRYVK